MHDMTTAKLALVGDRSPSVRAHGRIPLLVDALRRREGLVLDPYWIPSTEAEDLEGFDGIWVVPGSPYTDPEKVDRGGRDRPPRRDPVPRHLRRLPARDPAPRPRPGRHRGRPPRRVRRTETDVIVQLECSLVGHEGPITYTPDTLMARIAGVERSLERYHCSYGIAPSYVEALEEAGVIFGAHDDDNAPRALELHDHPFFLGTLFQPELAGDGTRAHPVIRAFAEATSLRARGRSSRASLPA